ncbi:hypothetical protein TRVL_06703 [Trypanosoma vivax]|uniref:Uncharacterized protein n=1 Tax=Trypanosoma vivax (strain Y486) TaxID=1055687 RepID=G0TRR4_TRYVY|nr:hypothetical protein TRVL_06703 [Trypanosoma vivax]CCC46636.1 conserved hypothetical protein [Trypanosoma vivax Y486]
MYRRALCRQRSWGNSQGQPLRLHDPRGRFNLDEAAAALDLDPAYAASLYRPLHYTYHLKGQLYPAERGRPSRPGSLSASRGRMFPLFKRNERLHNQFMRLDRNQLTTD